MSELVKIAGWARRGAAAVVFVHGLNGHGYETWGDPASPEYWPRALARDVEGLDAWVLHYDAPASNWQRTSMALQDRASNVLERLLASPELRERPLVFICHSLGGLIIKQVLLDLNEQRLRRPEAAELLASTRGVIFIATPHSGSRQASWMQRLRLALWPTDIAAALVANSPTLRKLNVSYRGFADDRRASLRHLVFYETRGTMAGAIVDPSSSDPGLPGNPPVPIDADHVSICKPLSRTDLVVVKAREFVTSIAGHHDGSLQYRSAALPFLPRNRSHAQLLPKLVRLTVLVMLVGGSVWAVSQRRELTETAGAPAAATTVLAGEVRDARTGEPLANVLITLPEFDIRQQTSGEGRYSFELPVAPGTFVRLRAQRDGYKSLDEDPQVGGSHVDVLVMEEAK